MTTPTPTQALEPVEVTQADRNAAATIVASGNPGVGNGNKVIADEIKGGLHDKYNIVQAFARHRQSSSNAGGVDGLIAHFTRMMEAAANYLEPTTYVARHPQHGLNGPCRFTTEFPMPDESHSDSAKADINGRRDQAFIRDMIYMLDGPEQRAALPSHKGAE